MLLKDYHSIIILGASGNLALTKLLPALYDLYASGSLPQEFSITGYARSEISNEQYRQEVISYLKKYVKSINFFIKEAQEFIEHIFYFQGQYDSAEDFAKLSQSIKKRTLLSPVNSPTLYYLSIPPSIFSSVILALNESGSITKAADSPQAVIVEKPFGYDTNSAQKLNEILYQVFDEAQIYRIDHYLGKEAIQNLLTLRFANTIFEPIWSNKFIESVTISWEEPLSVGSRGGYFDQAGIIRDVIQNHLLQILALVAMEKPETINSECIQKEKNAVINKIKKLNDKDIILGQYTSGVSQGKEVISYVEENSVPNDSKRETFASIKCTIDTPRWGDTPFILRAGKALTKGVTEIIIKFKSSQENLFANQLIPANKLIIRVQPDASIYFKINNKVPGRSLSLSEVKMNFDYGSSFNKSLPDAYERLLLDAIERDKTLFISYNELITSWQIFTPLLKKIDNQEMSINYYKAGTFGPE